MVRGMLMVAVLALFGGLATRAAAVEVDLVDIEYWAGEGANAAVLVADFQEASFAFGYRWDGDATSWDMLQALTAAGALDVTYTDYGMDLGIGINTLSYGEYVVVNDWLVTYLGFWTSEDGEVWSPSDWGVSFRPLTDGAWDGWSLELVETGWPPRSEPQTPVIPEPGTLGLLAAGVLMLGRRRGVRG